MKNSYTPTEVLILLTQAVEAAESDIYRGLKGASTEDRLNALDSLDMIDMVHRQIRIKVEGGDTHE